MHPAMHRSRRSRQEVRATLVGPTRLRSSTTPKRTNKSSRIDEEKLCAECFQRLLSARFGISAVEVERMPRGADPPDFWFTIEGQRFPVEVSSLVEKVVTDGRADTTAGVHDRVRKFVCNVEEDALRAGCLSGEYVIWFGACANVHDNRKDLERSAVDFVRHTQLTDTTEEHPIVEGGHNTRITICKLTPDRAHVGAAYVGAKWQAESAAEVRELIEERIMKKRCALEKKGITAQDKPVLILYDAYLHADIDDIRRAVSSLKAEPWFHSIACVRSKKISPEVPLDGECWLLVSEEPRWRDPEALSRPR